MKKNLTKKLMLSVLTLAFAVVSLGASTFAWFTLSKNAEVEAFSSEVIGGSGLEIQVLNTGGTINDNNWHTAYLTAQQIKDVYEPNPTTDPFKFDAANPIITANKISGFKDQTGVEVEEGFIKFDLAFKLTNTADTKVYNLFFDGYSFATSGEKEWTVNQEYVGTQGTYKVGDERTYLIQDAARLGISVLQDGVNATDIPEAYYQGPAGSTEYTADMPEDKGAFAYYNAVNKTTQLDTSKRTSYTAAAAVGADSAGDLIGQLSKDAVVRITVYVWIEGWDGECINAIFSQTLATSLSFYLDTDNPVA